MLKVLPTLYVACILVYTSISPGIIKRTTISKIHIQPINNPTLCSSPQQSKGWVRRLPTNEPSTGVSLSWALISAKSYMAVDGPVNKWDCERRKGRFVGIWTISGSRSMKWRYGSSVWKWWLRGRGIRRFVCDAQEKDTCGIVLRL